MNKQILKYSSAVALLLGSSSAISMSTQVADSPDGITGPAPCLTSYKVHESGAQTGGDYHAVHGIQLKNGDLVSAGSGGQNGETFNHGTGRYALVTKKGKWTAQLGILNKGAEANWVAESQDGSYLIVVGYQENDAEMSDCAVWKLDSNTGALIWTMTFASGFADGLETVAMGPDGSFAVGGFVGSSIPIQDLKFKSAGQVEEGHPFVAMISAENANGSEAPETFDWFHYEYQRGAPFKGSAKAIRISDNGDIHALCGKRAAIMVLDKSGQMVIANEPGEYIDPDYQASDLELIPGGGYMLTGLTAHVGSDIRKSATNEKVSKDLKKVWRKSYGNYPGGVKEYTGLGTGDKDLVIDECWGIMSTKNSAGVVDGYAIACGTGIENCNGVPPSKVGICQADPRTNWRSLVVATDLNGSRVWSRMDTFPGAEGPSATAAEYIFPLQNGGIGVITDEAFGMGFLELSAPTGHKQQCSAPALAQRKSNSTNSTQPSPLSQDPLKLFKGSNSTNSTQAF